MSFLHFELLWTIVDEYNHDRETKESSKLVAQRLRNGVGSSVVAIDDILCEHFANKILVNVVETEYREMLFRLKTERSA